MVALNSQETFRRIGDVIAHYNGSGECAVKTWAHEGRIAASTAYEIVHGMAQPSYETLRLWFLSRRIPRAAKLHLVVMLLSGSGIVATATEKQTRIGFAADVEGEVIDVTAAGQILLKRTHDGLADGRIDAAEAVGICAAAAKVQSEAAQVAGIVGVIA